MSDPAGYAERVRAYPYGPFEVTAGALAIWLHGPFVVLTFTGSDGSFVTLSGAADDAGLGRDLAEFFRAAPDGSDLTDAGRLSVEHRAGHGEAPRATRLTARMRQNSCQLTLQIDAARLDVRLDRTDLVVHAEALQGWADAIGADAIGADAIGADSRRYRP